VLSSCFKEFTIQRFATVVSTQKAVPDPRSKDRNLKALTMMQPRSTVIATILGLAVLFLHQFAFAVIRDGGIDPANLGKGEWIYFMSSTTNKLGGNVSAVTNEVSLMKYFKSQGIRYIIVKAGTSDQLFNGGYNFPQFTSDLCDIAHQEGLLIFGYNRSYGQNVPGEIAIVDYVFNQGADGFVYDAEGEWESDQSWIGPNGPAKAWQLCSTARAHWPNKFFAYSPLPIISFHNTFPYKEFGYWCDNVMPQIYHFSTASLKQSVSAAINWTDVNWYNWQNSLLNSNSIVNGQMIYWTNAIKPIVPIQDVYGPLYSTPYPNKDVMEFIDYLAADPNPQTVGGYKGVNFFRCDLHGSVQWANINEGTSGDFPGIVNNIVIDDPNASVTGAWTPVRTFYNATFYGANGTDTNSFGTNYLTITKGNGSRYVQFNPNVVTSGDYDIYQWHVYRPDASASVPFEISSSSGTTTIYANQQTNSGNWTLLGRFTFTAGGGGYIRITDNFPEPNAVAIADGLKLVFVPVPPPTAPANVTAQAVPLSPSQILLNWRNTATNYSGVVVARSILDGGPYTNVATLPKNLTTYTDTNLLANTTYYYVIRATNASAVSPDSNQASATTTGPAVAPTILIQPQDQATPSGGSASFAVVASGPYPLSYQWLYFGTPIPGATNSSYFNTDAVPTDSGDYSVFVSNAYGSTPSATAILSVTQPYQPNGWTHLWNLAGGCRPYLGTNGQTERGLAYNPQDNKLFILSRSPSTNIYVLDGDTGADLYTMNINPTVITGGTYPLLLIGVADDGVVYAGNLTTAGSTISFRLYRWANDDSSTAPKVAFSGDPCPPNNQRWGDTFAVRGAGKNTQIILGSRNGAQVAILTTSDGTNFVSHPITVPDVQLRAFGLGIAFGEGDTFWGKSIAMPLSQVAFDLSDNSAELLNSYPAPFPLTVSPIGVSASLNLLAGIGMESPDNLKLYDISDPYNPPVPLGTNNFATANTNTFYVGAIAFGRDRVYALDPNNGIIAMQLTSTNRPALPRFISSIPFTNQQVQFKLALEPGISYKVETSTDMHNWSMFTTLFSTNSTVQFMDSVSPAIPRRFYRASWPAK
jgi:hypothetical protein